MQLWNLSSGIPVSVMLAENIIGAKKRGEEAYKRFNESRVDCRAVNSHAAIPRQNTKLFKTSGNKATIKSSNKSKSIEVNRNILGNLLTISYKNECAVDFETAL